MLTSNLEKIFIIIPCFNEQENVAGVIEEIRQVNDTWKILIINDGSEDQTSATAKNTNEAIVIDMPINTGVGGAVQTGFIYALNANADYAVKFDGDGQHDPEFLCDLLLPIKNNQADIVIGSRFMDINTGFKSSFLRRIGIAILQKLCSWLSGQPITDPTSGFRAYSPKAIQFMAKHYPSFDYPEPEEIVLATKNSLKIVELPITMRKRNAGHSTISSAFSVYYMIKVTLAMFFIALREPTKERPVIKNV